MEFLQQLDPQTRQLIELAAAFLAGCGVTALVAWGLAGSRRSGLEQEIARLGEKLDAERRIGEERERVFAEARGQLEASFSLLSGDALKRNSEQFLKLAEERLSSQQTRASAALSERQQAIEALVKPIGEALTKTERQIQEMEKERKEAFGALERHLALMSQDHQALRGETRNLVQALRRPEVRGRWGEITLKRLVEMAGMVEHCDFSEQVQADGADGRLRPDMVIRLPDEREIVVDVKTPLDAYLTAQEASDDAAREKAMAQHVRNVRNRVKELAEKAYWEQFRNSPDFVVLFIPGEQFLAAALDRDPRLLEDALRAKVILATPSSFVALLRAVAFSWRQVHLIRNAEQVRSLAEEFYKRVATFTEHSSNLGKSLARTVDHFNRMVGSMDRQLLPSARRLTELGVSAPKDIVEPEQLETRVRDVDES